MSRSVSPLKTFVLSPADPLVPTGHALDSGMTRLVLSAIGNVQTALPPLRRIPHARISSKHHEIDASGGLVSVGTLSRSSGTPALTFPLRSNQKIHLDQAGGRAYLVDRIIGWVHP